MSDRYAALQAITDALPRPVDADALLAAIDHGLSPEDARLFRKWFELNAAMALEVLNK